MNKIAQRTLMVTTILLVLAASPLPSYAQETINVVGQVTNGTAGAAVPQELAITLEVYQEGQVKQTMETVADEQGGFVFEGVPGEGHGYVISTEYSDVTYLYESDFPLPLEPVNLVVYESTGSMATIEVTLNTLVVNLVDTENRLMKITELVGLVNSGDRTFVPGVSQDGTMNILQFSLPTAAQDLQVQSSLWSGQIVETKTGFALTSPVPPGSNEIIYTYFSPYESGKLTFNHSFPFGASTFRVLMIQDLGRVKGTEMQEKENLVLGDRNYQQLEARSLAAGDSIALEFTGLSEPSLLGRWQDAVSGGDAWKVVLPVSFSVALVALLAFVLLRRREPERATVSAGRSVGQDSNLIEALARLDDRFQQGEIGEREYLQRRRGMKARGLGFSEPESHEPRGTQP